MGRAERLVKRYRAGDPRALDQLRDTVRPYTEGWIRRTSGQGNAAPYPSLIQKVMATKPNSQDPLPWVGYTLAYARKYARKHEGDPEALVKLKKINRDGKVEYRFRIEKVRCFTCQTPFPCMAERVEGGWELEDAQPLWGERGQPEDKSDLHLWQYHHGDDEILDDVDLLPAKSGGYNLADLEEISEAALLEAAATFDPSKGRRFTTWLHEYRSNRFLNMRARDYRKAQKYGPPRMDVIPDEPPEALDLVEGDAPEQAIRWLRLRLQYPAAKKKGLAHALGITPRQGRKYAAFWRERLTAQPIQQDDDRIPKRNAYGIEDPTPWNAGRIMEDPEASIEVGGSYNWTPGPSRRMPHDSIANNERELIEAGLAGQATPWRPMTPAEWTERFPGESFPSSAFGVLLSEG